MSGSGEGTLLLGPGPVGVAEAMRALRVLALVRPEARIEALVRAVGIVMTGQTVQSGPLLLTLASRCRKLYMILTASRRIVPEQQSIFTNLTEM